MANDPMHDYLATLNTQLGTIPGPGKVTPENMPLAFMHHAQKHAQQQQQAQMQVGEPTIEQQPNQGVGQPQMERHPDDEMQDGDHLPPTTFHINGHKVEAHEGTQAHKDLMKLLKSTAKAGKASGPKAARAGENPTQTPDFMEKLANAFTRSSK